MSQDPSHHHDTPDWTSFGYRPHPLSAREFITDVPPRLQDILDERTTGFDQPFVGVTIDGTPRTGLRRRDAGGPRVDTAPVTEAALAFLQALTTEQRERASYPMDSAEWRRWINVHMNHFRHGVMLEDTSVEARQAALAMLQATLSARGYDQAKAVIWVNEFVAKLTDNYVAFGEWPYFVSIFGNPAPGSAEPWGWQFDGHHLCINCVVFDDRLVMTPAFMGAEPRTFHDGPLAGTLLFEPEEMLGLQMIRSLDAGQREQAILHASILPANIPRTLQHPFDGRMQAGAFHDNMVLPYQGVSGADLSDAQRRMLADLAGAYVGWNRDDLAAISMTEVRAHLDETWFSWYGGYDDSAPFYYRVQSPVILIEFDHHPGVVLDNDAATRHHVHTVVRTPNGGDYGADLLRQHYEQFDHRHGTH